MGTEGPKAHIKAYRGVGVNTEAVVTRLKANGISTSFDWVQPLCQSFTNRRKSIERNKLIKTIKIITVR